VLTWLASLTWLVLREYSPGASGDDAVPAQVRLAPTTSFSGLWAGPTQVGLASVTTDTLPEGFRVTSRLDVDIPLPLVPRRLLSTIEARYDRRLRLQGYLLTASGEAGQVTLTATSLADTLLSVIIIGRGLTSADTVEITVPADVLRPDSAGLAHSLRYLMKPGATETLQVLDPLDMAVTSRQLQVGAESTFVMPDSAALDSVTRGWIAVGRDSITALSVSWMQHGMPVHAWIDRRGTILAQASPLGLTQRKAPFEIVNSGYARRRPQNVQSAPLEVAAPVTVPVRSGRLTLGPVDLRAAAPMLDSPWQVVAGGALEARTGPPLRAAARVRIPDSIPSGDRTMPTGVRLLVEARRVAGSDTANPAAATRKLAEWIAGTVSPGSPSLTGPERALARRRGDSSDRADLLVAMARALDIPARPVAGLLASGGRLRYRAWAEVWIGGWVPVDPTLGQFPADAGHFRLLTHASARPLTVAPMAGAVRPVLTTPTTTP